MLKGRAKQKSFTGLFFGAVKVKFVLLQFYIEGHESNRFSSVTLHLFHFSRLESEFSVFNFSSVTYCVLCFKSCLRHTLIFLGMKNVMRKREWGEGGGGGITGGGGEGKGDRRKKNMLVYTLL